MKIKLGLDSFKNNRLVEVLVIVLLGIVLFSFAKNKTYQHPNWSVKYFSGAKNLTLDNVWRYSRVDLNEILESEDTKLMFDYEFKRYDKAQLEVNFYNAKGFLYISWAASKVFFWMPIVKAVQAFNFLIHLIISILVFYLIPRNKRYLFLLLYVLNPLIIYLVTYPYYYFYQIIPSFILLILYRKKIPTYLVLISFMIMGFALNVRATMVFLILISTVLVFKKYGGIVGGLAFLMLISSYFLTKPKNTTTSRWHTTYVGIGAYPNKYLSELSDESGVKLYEKKTGTKIKPVLDRSIEYIEQYNEVCKTEFYRIFKESPFLIVKNASLNVLQSFSLGHFSNRSIYINYFSAFLGLLFVIWLLFKKMYLHILVIGLAAGSFTPYFPPTQQYMFGSFILIFYSLVESINVKRIPFLNKL